ncbi:MAG TPA: peptidase S41 [Tenacibaculum sp.]|nr:peptidase S41 [Tenacibaculum sp.]
MNKNNLPIYFSIAVIFGIFIGIFFNNGKHYSSITKRTSSNEQKIRRLIEYIQSDYVDTVNTDQLLDNAIAEMLDKLDPHSVYIPKENLQSVTENMQGNFVGIGIQFRMKGDTITVVDAIKGGPSIKVGIKAGDRILMSDNDTLYGKKIKSSEILKKLKGKPNTKVNLQIYRKTNDSLFNIDITRGKVNIKSVDIAYMLTKNIGYIKVNRFARNTYREFKTSLDTLLTKGMETLVLDLRNNGGGFIDIANKLVDEFLEDDKLIVYTKNNKGAINKSFATNRGSFENGKLYVLIDENSASASEIVAGAIQDNDKGTIIGRRSFGKGLVQQEMDLGDGSAIRLTTARYYTPTGRSIQKPYKKNKKSSNYREDIENRFYNGELFNKDSIKTTDSLQFKTPEGKIVYGGGGIIPDVFVPIDTTSNISTFIFIPLQNFAFDYVDNNRATLNTLSIDEFIETFDSNHKISKLFFSKIKDFKLSNKSKSKIKNSLKTVIARDLFNDEGLYKLSEKDDKMIQKVLKLEKQTKNLP